MYLHIFISLFSCYSYVHDCFNELMNIKDFLNDKLYNNGYSLKIILY